MTDLDKRLAAKAALVPKTGFNLVGVDSFERPGEELFFVEHFEDAQAAQAALEERERNSPDERYYLYTPDA